MAGRGLVERAEAEAYRTLGLAKQLNMSREEILVEAATADGCCRGSRAQGWSIRLRRGSEQSLNAVLFGADNRPVVGLEYHARACEDLFGHEIPGGWYHWDVHPPVVVRKYRIRAWKAPTRTWSENDTAVLDHVHNCWRATFNSAQSNLYDRRRKPRR